jgi:aminoglycoside 3-N-acetyltransferase
MENQSFKTLVSDLKALGIQCGDVVIVHSSLSSMGFVEGGAETVILALEEVIGEEGTLMFPTFTYADPTHKFSVFDSEVCVGKIPNTFRGMPGVIRSVNPTHSVAAWGKLSKEITEKHYLDRTPFGDNSPYARLAELGGKILMLGCSLLKMSYLHRIEEEAGALYCLHDTLIDHEVTDYDGNTYIMKYTRHGFTKKDRKYAQKYTRCTDVLTEGEDYTVGRVHGAECYLFSAKALHDKALKKMETEPYYFVDEIPLEK